MLVTVTDVRGHTPRDAGAKMVVSADATWGSIGGGNLEEEAVRRARDLLSSGGAVARVVHRQPVRQGAVPARRAVLRGRGDRAAGAAAPSCPSVAIFGVGHVGLELARILARHDLDLHLVDSRAEHLSADVLAPLDDAVAAVHVHPVPVLPELVLAELPRGHPGAGADPRPRRGPRDRRRRAARDHLGPDRADRLVGEVGAVPRSSCSTRASTETSSTGSQTPIGLPGRDHEQGPGGDRGVGGGRAARGLRARERRR